MTKALLITILLLNFTYAMKPLVKLKTSENIYACFNEVDTKNEKSFSLIIRNNKEIPKSFYLNRDGIDNAVLFINMTQTKSSSSFGVTPLIYEGQDKLEGKDEGWNPKLRDDTIFTARGNLQAVTIQKKEGLFIYGEYLQFASKEKPLICTTSPDFAKELVIKAFDSDPFKKD